MCPSTYTADKNATDTTLPPSLTDTPRTLPAAVTVFLQQSQPTSVVRFQFLVNTVTLSIGSVSGLSSTLM